LLESLFALWTSSEEVRWYFIMQLNSFSNYQEQFPASLSISICSSIWILPRPFPAIKSLKVNNHIPFLPNWKPSESLSPHTLNKQKSSGNESLSAPKTPRIWWSAFAIHERRSWGTY
jgi:hypothetical protein